MATTHHAGRRPLLAIISWLAVLLAGLWLFHRLGSGWLEPPPLDPAGWDAWASGRDPLVATVAVLRLVVLALGWYLLVTTVLGVLARLIRAPRAIRAVDLVTIPALRRFLANSLGVSLVAAMVASGPSMAGFGSVAHATPGASEPVSGASQVDEPPGETGQQPGGGAIPLPLDLASGSGGDDVEVLPSREVGGGPNGPASSAGSQAVSPADDSSVIVLQEVHGPTQDGRESDHVISQMPLSITQAAAEPATQRSTSGEQTVLVQPGDSLWSIARDALSAAQDEPPTDGQVATYWSVVIERNRADLPDPDNPDLIFPGDVIVLPPLGDVGVRP